MRFDWALISWIRIVLRTQIYLTLAIMTNENGFLSPEARPQIRRLSSATASFEDLSIGPMVVVPPEQMQQPSDAHETAVAMEMAKHRLVDLNSSESGVSTPGTPPVTTTTDSYAFAFDIDGVLIRGGKVSTSRSLFFPLRLRQGALKCVSGHFQDLFHCSPSHTRRVVLTPKLTIAHPSSSRGYEGAERAERVGY